MKKENYSVLIVGSGGREHALAWKIAQSPLVGQIYCAPGNPGTAQVGTNVAIKANDIAGLKQFALENKIDITIVGPEEPLVNGIVDEFQAAGLKIFGPNKAAAQLEGSKVFTKAFMKYHSIPTSDFEKFMTVDACRNFLAFCNKEDKYPLVIKVDGLAAGKGVCVCHNHKDALDFLQQIEAGKFKGADAVIIVEKFLKGEEASYIAMVDDQGHVLSLASSQDHKARDDGDQGPNTGGMGAYSPAPVITPEVEKKIMKKIIEPVLCYLKARHGIKFTGFLYAGLMIEDGEPYVLEFNVRLGDPETQPILFRMKSDLLKLILAAVNGKLNEEEIQWDPNPAVCVVMASKGYPGDCNKGFVITGIDEAEATGAKVFHAGTILDENSLLRTAGGRVLGVTAGGKDYQEAIDNVYIAAEEIECSNFFCRTDIGHRAIER